MLLTPLKGALCGTAFDRTAARACRRGSSGGGLQQSRSQATILHQTLLILRLQHAYPVCSLNVVTVSRRLSFQPVMHRFQLRFLHAEPRFQSLNPGLGVFSRRVNFG